MCNNATTIQQISHIHQNWTKSLCTKGFLLRNVTQNNGNPTCSFNNSKFYTFNLCCYYRQNQSIEKQNL